MRKQWMMAAVLAGALALTGCGGNKKSSDTEEKGASVEAEAATDKTTSADEAVSEADEAVEAISEEAQDAAEDAIIEDLGSRPTYKALDYVTVGTYKGLTVQVDEIEISEEEIDQAIADAVSAADKYEELTEGTVQNGDVANIDYVGKKDDVAFEGGTAEGYDLTIGSGTFIPGFEEGLVDVKIGDTVDLDLTFPEAYHSEELAGADVVFTVTVHSVKRMPEITDALVGELSEGAYTTVDAYREYQQEQLKAQAEEEQEAQVSSELMTQLYNTCTVNDYPSDLVDYSVTEMNNYYKAYAQSMGVEFADFLSTYLGMDEETYDQQVRATIERSLQQELILMAIAETEGLDQLSDEDYEAGCERYAQQLGFESADAFKSAYDEDRVRASLAMDAAMDLVRENAVVITPDEMPTEAVTE